MTITATVKNVFCGGALITSDELMRFADDELNCAQATIVTGEAVGESVPVHRSRRSGALLLGRTVYHETQGHDVDCQGETFCECEDCEGRECSCDVKGEWRYEPLPLASLKAGDAIALLGVSRFVEVQQSVAQHGLIWATQ